ncbi:hypothetical protein PIN31115_02092 [Pandoraea iniqua]|uniref:Uncharacterized protein n=1 Tax=Pandoraea iniqua TaxID=2508288 RepID=A0A5E4UL76_9BURK|nr:hypothetical protein [Pandoraea iniqua]VVE00788.1 hypothetical protein PIN31115_02092 [Pandoraea iniqua]
MATSSGPVILPQFQGDYLDVQRKQQLAQALMGVAMSNGGDQLNKIGAGMPVMPKYSIGSGLTQLAQAYLGAKLGNDAIGGMRNLGAQQMQFLTGGVAPGAAPSAAAAPDQAPQPAAAGAPVGVSAGGGVGGSMQVANPFGDGDADRSALANAMASQRSQSGGFLSPGGANNPAGLPVQMAAQMYLSNPDKYWEVQAGQYKPAEIVSQLRAAGIDPSSTLGQQLAQQSLVKANYIAPVSLRPGGYMFDPMSGKTQQMPHVPDGFTAVSGQDGQWNIVPVQGGLGAIADTTAARARGNAQYNLKEVFNPQTNQMEYQTATNVADAANGGAPSGNLPAPIRNNNPGALMPGGKLAQFGSPQEGLAAMDNNLQSYGKQGVNTLSGVISKWAPPNENDTQAYIADVSQRLGIKPNQQIDLSNPFVRQAIGSAIMLRENGPSGVFGYPGTQGAPAAPAGARGFAAAPALGAATAANTSQGAPSKQMADAQSALSDSDSVYQQSREALTSMINLARNQGVGGTMARFAPDGVATRLSTDAAEYGKLHANYVSLQGKALGAAGSDASRATINESVPTYDKPQDAKISGLNNQLNQLDLMHLKRQVMNPIFQQGNEKAYSQQSAAFDNMVKPTMMTTITPILQMNGDQQRSAVQQAIKQNASMRPVFEMLFNTGMLK